MYVDTDLKFKMIFDNLAEFLKQENAQAVALTSLDPWEPETVIYASNWPKEQK